MVEICGLSGCKEKGLLYRPSRGKGNALVSYCSKKVGPQKFGIRSVLIEELSDSIYLLFSNNGIKVQKKYIKSNK